MNPEQKQKRNNPLAGYNTEAYVPRREDINTGVSGAGVVAPESTSISGAASGVGTSAANAGAMSSTSTSGNTAQTHGEAPRGPLQPKAVSNSPLSQKAPEMAENGLKTENAGNGSSENSKKWLVVIAVVMLALVVAGGAWWLLWGRNGGQQGSM